jgi:D-lactate dehydrogenase (cytochrome)
MIQIDGIEKITADYSTYLKDESRLNAGDVLHIAFPLSEADIVAFLRKMDMRRVPVTVSGARTGIVGGAVPMEGALLSLEKMDRILDIRETGGEWRVVAQPGLLIQSLQEQVEKRQFQGLKSSPALEKFLGSEKRFFYPVDPTEASATLGGTVATNASGERSYHYGPTRRYVRRLRVVLASGDVLDLKRGEAQATSRRIAIDIPGMQPIAFDLPDYEMPRVKSAAGYYSRDHMDLIDLFIGSEGTLGVFSEVEVALVPRPAHILSIVAFFPSDADAVSFFTNANHALPGVLVFEYFDSSALQILREKREREGGASGIAALPEKGRAAIFLEVAMESTDELEKLCEPLEDLLKKNHSSMDDTWSGFEDRERARIRALRHAVPESVNEIVAQNKLSCPSVCKIGTDMAVPGDKFEEMLVFYKALLRDTDIQYAIFGHIGEYHLHVNMMPRTEQGIERAKSIIMEYARKVVAFGGTVSAEHGIGKIKHPYLEILYGKNGMLQMAAVKKALDPHGILGRGNIFPASLLA